MAEEMTAAEQKYFETGDASALAEDAPQQAPADAAAQEAAPVVEQAAEADAAPVAPEKPEEKPEEKAAQHQVPVSHLVDERQARKAAEKRAAELEDKFNLVTQRLDVMQKAWMQPEPEQRPQQPTIPDPDDTVGNVEWLRSREEERLRHENDSRQAARERDQHLGYANDVMKRWQSFNGDAAQDPEYAQARDHLLQSRFRELLADGVPEHVAKQQITGEEFQLAADAFQNQKNLLNIYKAKAAARGWNFRPPVQEQAQPTPVAAAEKLRAVAEGQKENTSLSSGGSGAAPKGQLSIKDLADMPEDQFADFMKKRGPKGFMAVMASRA